MNRILWRDIRKTLGRFVSIMTIVALGVAFFVGIRSIGPDMDLTGEEYFDRLHLMDLHVVSTYGFDEDDRAALADYAQDPASPVAEVMPGYSLDVFIDEPGTQRVVKLMSLDLNRAREDHPGWLNRPELVEGRMPQGGGECLIDERLAPGLGIGDTLRVATDKEDALARDAFTIVGVARNPLYITFDRGNSSIGSGQVSGYALVPAEDFAMEVATEVYATLRADADPAAAKDALKELGSVRSELRYEKILTEGREKIGEAAAELADAEAQADEEIADAQKKIDEAHTDLAEGQQKAADAQLELDDAIAKAQKEIDDGRTQQEKGQQSLRDTKRQLDSSATQLARAQDEQKQAQAKLDAVTASMIEAMNQQEKAAYDKQKAQLAAAASELAKQATALKSGQASYEEALRQFYIGRNRLNAAEEELSEKRVDAQGEIDQALSEIQEGDVKLAESEAELADARAQAEIEIADAHEKIDSAQSDLDALKPPEWYIMDRDANPGLASYDQDAQRIDAIGQVFPWIFYLVAMLVCLTTITRMVEEQRTEIGTLKALGFTPWAIAGKYILYALSASALGSLAGIPVGVFFLPNTVFSAYSILYTLPELSMPVQMVPVLLASLSAMILVSLTALLVCRRSLTATPASLMRPKVPKPGKRVFLERITPLWRRMNFSAKVTARNLLRYKGRFFMTVIGVAGCSALMLTGFGIKDSVDAIFTLQFGGVMHYDVQIAVDADAQELTEIDRALAAMPGIDGYILVRQAAREVFSADPARTAVENATVMVPSDPDALAEYITMRNRQTGQPLSLPDDGAIVTEKLAQLLSLKVGDAMIVEDGNHRRTTLSVAGITENYAAHYVYLSPQGYALAFGEDAVPNAALIQAPEASLDQASLGGALLAIEGVNTVGFLANTRDRFGDTLGNMYPVIYVLIIAAAALALVVLLNLTNINISERRRELATIRVLGFHDTEVGAYVYRENTVLTLLGIALGLFVGIFLHRYVMATAEVNLVMFGRSVAPLSYLWATALSLLFAFLANLLMIPKLRGIDMVESLKGVE